jgi:transposase
MNTQKMTYIGRQVFIGIDVHKRTYTLGCLCDGNVVKRCRMPASPARLIEFIEKVFSRAQISSTYEAGFSGYGLHRYLRSHGVASLVVHAAWVEVSTKNVKTDKRDSMTLAVQFAAGRLRGIRVPSEEEEQRRLLTRTREQLIRHRRRVMNQIRMKLHQFGLLEPEYAQKLSHRKVQAILDERLPEELRISLKSLVALWGGSWPPRAVGEHIGVARVTKLRFTASERDRD